MTAEAVDPLAQPGWDAWVASRPEAQFFHGAAWARVLRETYGHRPLYVRGGMAAMGMLPLMEVRSVLTGVRGVSLPFTDFCGPLRGAGMEDGFLYEAAMQEGRRRGWRYLECRGGEKGWPGASPSLSFWGHEIDLTVGPGRLGDGLDGAVRRAVRKAEKAELEIEFGASPSAMAAYYALHCRTRKRHGLPPQPFRFFDNIQKCMTGAGQGEIGLAFRDKVPIAGAVYLWLGRRAMYKFGASDESSQEWRPNDLLMWRAMERYADRGFEALHLGRTSLLHNGLRRFKLGFGAQEKAIHFCRFDFGAGCFVTDVDRVEGWFNTLFRSMPLFVLRLAGKMLYPHLS